MTYNGYLSADEREYMIESARIQNEFDKLSTLLEMVILQEEQAIRDAEFKVFSESGTYDDLTYLVEEVQAETEVKKKNIFARIFATISNFFKKIFGKADAIKSSQEETVEVPENYQQHADTIAKAANAVPNSVSSFITRPIDGVTALKTIFAGIIAIGGYNFMKKTKMAKAAADKITESIKKSSEKIKSAFDTFSNFLSGSKGSNSSKEGNEGSSIFAKALNAINKLLNSVKTGISNLIHGKKKESPEEVKGRQLAKNGLVEKKDKNGNTVYIDTTTGKSRYVDKNGKEIDYEIKNGQILQNVGDTPIKSTKAIEKKAQQVKGKAEVAAKNNIDARDNEAIDNKKENDIKFSKDQTGGATVIIRGSTGKMYINGQVVKLDNTMSDHELAYKLRDKGVTNKKMFKEIYRAYSNANFALNKANEQKAEINKRRLRDGMQALESENDYEILGELLIEAGYDIEYIDASELFSE